MSETQKTTREFIARVADELNLDLRDPFTLLLANACALLDMKEELERELRAAEERIKELTNAAPQVNQEQSLGSRDEAQPGTGQKSPCESMSAHLASAAPSTNAAGQALPPVTDVEVPSSMKRAEHRPATAAPSPEMPDAEDWQVMWRREWDGDDSDLYMFVYADTKEDLDEHGPWEKMYSESYVKELRSYAIAQRERAEKAERDLAAFNDRIIAYLWSDCEPHDMPEDLLGDLIERHTWEQDGRQKAEQQLRQAQAALRNAPTIYADHRDIAEWREQHATAIGLAAMKDKGGGECPVEVRELPTSRKHR